MILNFRKTKIRFSMDFTTEKYRALLEALLRRGYRFLTFEEYLKDPYAGKVIVLRHDVDLLPYNSLRIAEIEAALGIKGVYYFRAVPESWNEEVIRRISSLGHEVGYHYESLTICKGDIDAAYGNFCANLEKLRKLVKVTTICMHGSPRSSFDSKDIWQKYSYRESGIAGEPYFDIDFSRMFYLTDTGRRWDGYKMSVRDRIEGFSENWEKEGKTYHTTQEIIEAAEAGRLPGRIMFTVHPQRWNPFGLRWGKELLMQNAKNIVKRVLVAKRRKYQMNYG